jgi:aminoglycoside phosphotransferase (APT) family kinase protein
VNPERVESYLQSRLGSGARLVSLKRSAQGLSRETWFARIEDRGLVLRCDLPGGASSVPTTLRFEYEIYRRLADTPVPVARALWFEDDPAPLGRPLYVREMIDGDQDVAHLHDPDPRYDELRIAVSKEHARKMALVHSVDWKALKLDELMPAPRAAADCGVATIDRIETAYRKYETEPEPLIEAAFEWMRKHAPQNAPAVALCKGSNGEWQEIWRDGAIVGMSDWELASLGDPANDWARCNGFRPVVAGRWDERRLMDYYEEISGLHIDLASLDFYRLVYALEMLLVCLHAGLPVRSGALPDARLAMLSTGPRRRFHAQLGKAMGLKF